MAYIGKIFTVAAMAALTISCSGDGDGDGSSSSCGEQGGGSSSSMGGGDKGNDIKNYRTVIIGTQTWMAENLNYDVVSSKCNGEDGPVYDYDEENDDIIEKILSEAEVQANCDKYGRLYDWATAMGFDANCNKSNCTDQIAPLHQGICPNGWHIPSNDDWDKLFRYVDNVSGSGLYDSPTAGKYLKATSGWNSYNGISGNGTDQYGFSALPSGFGGLLGGAFYNVGYSGDWWSSSEYKYDYVYAYGRGMSYQDEYADVGYGGKSHLRGVRCVKD